MSDPIYYQAYDNRYSTLHGQGIRWFGDEPTPLVLGTIRRLGLGPHARILELGCGEGRDAGAVLQAGYDLYACDVSPEAVRYCRQTYPDYADRFAVADCVAGQPQGRYDFVYAVSLLHMLVRDEHRDAFCRYVAASLLPTGHALVCVMGDGDTQRSTDPAEAFDLQPRHWGDTTVLVAATSCRMVAMPHFVDELTRAGLQVESKGVLECDQYGCLMYAVACLAHAD